MIDELSKNLKSIKRNMRIIWIELWVVAILASLGLGIIIGIASSP